MTARQTSAWAKSGNSRGSGADFSPGSGPNTAPTVSGRRYTLWFPARLGPKRKRSVTIDGQAMTVRSRRLELPPTKNDRLHWRSSGPWVREWRGAARYAAKRAGIPPLGRICVSGIVYRRALGNADAMNDLDRLHPLVDGLQDAGVIVKDTRRHVTYGMVTEERAGPDGPGVLLIVEEVS